MMHVSRRPGIIPPPLLHEMAQEIGIGLTRASRTALWLGLAGLLCLGIGVAVCIMRLVSGDIGLGRAVTSMVPYTGVWVAVLGAWIALRKVRHERIGRVMLRHLRCPHCGYDIRGLPVDPTDGATVCPECGCAWKLS